MARTASAGSPPTRAMQVVRDLDELRRVLDSSRKPGANPRGANPAVAVASSATCSWSCRRSCRVLALHQGGPTSRSARKAPSPDPEVREDSPGPRATRAPSPRARRRAARGPSAEKDGATGPSNESRRGVGNGPRSLIPFARDLHGSLGSRRPKVGDAVSRRTGAEASRRWSGRVRHELQTVCRGVPKDSTRGARRPSSSNATVSRGTRSSRANSSMPASTAGTLRFSSAWSSPPSLSTSACLPGYRRPSTPFGPSSGPFETGFPTSGGR